MTDTETKPSETKTRTRRTIPERIAGMSLDELTDLPGDIYQVSVSTAAFLAGKFAEQEAERKRNTAGPVAIDPQERAGG